MNTPPPENIGITAEFYYYTCLNFYYGTLKDAERRLEYAQKVMNLLHANPDFIEMNPRMYFSAASNLCQALLGISDFKRAENFIKQMKQHNIQGSAGIKREIYNEVMAGVLNAEILLNINYKNFPQAAGLETELVKLACDDKLKVGNFYFLELNFNMAHALFLSGNPIKALDYLENVLRHTNNDVRKDLQLVSRIFQLILHFDIGSTKLISSLAETTLRYLKRQKAITDFDKSLINLLKKNSDKKTKDWQHLLHLLQTSGQKRVSLLQGYVDITHWIKTTKLQQKIGTT